MTREEKIQQRRKQHGFLQEASPRQKTKHRLTDRGKRRILAILSAVALIACGVCIIVDYFVSGVLTWSLVVTVSIVAAWLVLFPVLTAKTGILIKSLSMGSIIPMLLLAALSILLERLIIFTLGSCISLIVIAAMWAIYGIFRRCRQRLWRACGLSLLLIILVPIAIRYVISFFLPQYQVDLTSNLFNSALTLGLSLVCFGIEHVVDRRKAGEGSTRKS